MTRLFKHSDGFLWNFALITQIDRILCAYNFIWFRAGPWLLFQDFRGLTFFSAWTCYLYIDV